MIDPLPLARASALAYTAVPWFQTDTCQVTLSIIDGVATFAFRGTGDFAEWMVDLFAIETIGAPGDPFGPVHAGFWHDSSAARGEILAWIDAHPGQPFRVIGHSKGGSEAILTHAALKVMGHAPLPTWVFEPAEAGSSALADFLGDEVQWTQTVNVHGVDFITRVHGEGVWATLKPEPRRLAVPDSYGVVAKHRIETVVAALEAK
jgi:lipase (class 3)